MLARSGVLNKSKTFTKSGKKTTVSKVLLNPAKFSALTTPKNVNSVLAHKHTISTNFVFANRKSFTTQFRTTQNGTNFGAPRKLNSTSLKKMSFSMVKAKVFKPQTALVGKPQTTLVGMPRFSPAMLHPQKYSFTSMNKQAKSSTILSLQLNTQHGYNTQKMSMATLTPSVLPKIGSNNANLYFLFIAAGLAGLLAFTNENNEASAEVDYNAVRKDIADLLDNPRYEDGSMGPLLIRLAWHASGTWDEKTKTGGSNGATMRFPVEANDGANAGLHIARDLLEPVKAKYPDLSYADLWTLAGVVAVEEAGGPTIPWRSGRVDATNDKTVPPNGRLPDASQGAQHIRDIFYRMGFNDQEIVALAGAHTFGRCHTDRSGFDGPWTKAPTMFSNSFYLELLNQDWTERRWRGPKQYADASGELMMLPADMAFRDDPSFRKWTELYANDEEKFAKDFSAAYSKLLHLGVPEKKPWWKFW